jgi:HlyD family secretion protein
MENKTMKEKMSLTKNSKRILLVAIAVAIVAGLAFGTWKTGLAKSLSLTQATSTPTVKYQSTATRLGNLALSISGTGQVLSAKSVDLGFSAAGKVATLMVQLGEQVTKGQVLGTLNGIEQLKLNVQNQQLAVQNAQKALDDLQSKSASVIALAQSKIDLASAQKAYDSAKANLRYQGQGRCSQLVTEAYEFDYENSLYQIKVWEKIQQTKNQYGNGFINEQIKQLGVASTKNYNNWKYCEVFTPEEILASQVALELSKAKLDQANSSYQDLVVSSGIDSEKLNVAQATLKNAQSQLAIAQKELDGATLVAPMDGVVTAVNGNVGKVIYTEDTDTTDITGSLVTISDLKQPEVQVNIDETDQQNFQVGCAAQVTFDSLAGQKFSGVVSQVSPTLVTVNSVSMVQGLVDLQQKTAASGKTLPLGMTATVEVTCHQVNNVLLIPAQALYQPESKPAYVYVLNAQNQPEKRQVTVGLQSVALAEIQSGLKLGEKVITTQIEAQ